MKKIFLLIFLTSCSFNDTGNYWTENNKDYNKNLEYNKDYSTQEYKKILKNYNKKTKYPNLN